MNLEKFTDRAKGFLQAAQTIAIRMNHQRISPEHIAKALLEDNEGMAAGLIQRAGGDVPRAVAGIDALLAKVPAVSGSGAQATPGLDNDAVRLLDQAEATLTRLADFLDRVDGISGGDAHPEIDARLVRARDEFRALIAADLNVPTALGGVALADVLAVH